MEADLGPLTQSSELTSGKSDVSVGPGVGSGLIAVQPAGADGWVGVASAWVAGIVGTRDGVAASVGVSWGEAACPWQAARLSNMPANNKMIFFILVFVILLANIPTYSLSVLINFE